MLFGVHVPVAQGYESASRYAAEVGCECMQIFSRSPRMWRTTSIDVGAAARFRQLRDELCLGPLFVHTAYLLNLGSGDETLWLRSVDALAEELQRASLLGAAALVTHIGTRMCEDTGACAERVAEAIRLAFDAAGVSDVELLMENTAGGGATFGGGFEELGQTLAALRSRDESTADRVGVCLDTCHAHAHGIDLSTQAGWHEALDDLDTHVGLKRLGLIHSNDSMFGLGSRRDRHAWVGDGTIGLEGFRAMVCESRLAHVPAVCEAPGEPPEKDVACLTRLKELRTSCGAGR